MIAVEEQSKKKHIIEVEDVSEEWDPVKFDFYQPYSPIKIYCLEFDSRVPIKTLKCRHELLCSRIGLNPMPIDSEPSASSYIDEIPFKL